MFISEPHLDGTNKFWRFLVDCYWHTEPPNRTAYMRLLTWIWSSRASSFLSDPGKVITKTVPSVLNFACVICEKACCFHWHTKRALEAAGWAEGLVLSGSVNLIPDFSLKQTGRIYSRYLARDVSRKMKVSKVLQEHNLGCFQWILCTIYPSTTVLTNTIVKYWKAIWNILNRCRLKYWWVNKMQ